VDGPWPGASCPARSSCLKQSKFYYQCLPTDGYTCIPASGDTGDAPPGGTGAPQLTLGWWDQCGGLGGDCAQYGCQDGLFANYACPSGG
jgi:hypothetical protein